MTDSVKRSHDQKLEFYYENSDHTSAWLCAELPCSPRTLLRYKKKTASWSKRKKKDKKDKEMKLPNDVVRIPITVPDIITQTADVMEYYQSRQLKVTLREVKDVLKETGLLQTTDDIDLPYLDLDPSFNLLYAPSQQRVMYSSIMNRQHTFVVGVRGTAKTTFTKEALAKMAVVIPNLKIHIFCGKIDTSKANLNEMKDWLLDKGMPSAFMTTVNAYNIEFANGSYIKAHANTQADIRKYRGHINWVDEAQLLSKPAMAALLGLFSGVEDFQFILTGNFGEINGSPFENFCRSADKEEICTDLHINFLELSETDITWTTDTSKTGLRKLMDATIGMDGTATQLDPVWVTPEGAIYDSDWITSAFTPLDFPVRFKDVVGGMDWGDGSETSMMVVGLGEDDHLYLLYAWAKKNCQTSDVKEQMLWCYEELGCNKWHWEGSPSGDFARKEIRADYGDMIQFSNSYFTAHKDRFLFNIHRYLGGSMIHFIDKIRTMSKDPLDLPYTKANYTHLRIFRSELERYCGDKKQDHMHDGIAHPIDKLVKQHHLIAVIEKAYNNKAILKA